MTVRKGKNRYAANAKISDASFRMLTRMFADDLAAVDIARRTGLNRNTVNRYTLALRRRILESYGGMRFGDYGDYIGETALFFGVRTDGGKVKVEPVNVCQGGAIRDMLSGGAGERGGDAEKLRQYDGVISIERSLRIYLNFGKIMRTSQPNNLTTTEDFFSYVKERMSKFYGISKKYFLIHLKECEFRYNYQSDDIYSLILKMTNETPLFIKDNVK